MNIQEAINSNYKRFLVDKKPPGISTNGKCMYRTPEGNCCGVGDILPNERYEPQFDGEYTSLVTIKGKVPEWEGLDTDDLRSLQAAHDSSALDAKCILGKIDINDQSFLELFREFYEAKLRSLAALLELFYPGDQQL